MIDVILFYEPMKFLHQNAVFYEKEKRNIPVFRFITGIAFIQSDIMFRELQTEVK